MTAITAYLLHNLSMGEMFGGKCPKGKCMREMSEYQYQWLCAASRQPLWARVRDMRSEKFP